MRILKLGCAHLLCTDATPRAAASEAYEEVEELLGVDAVERGPPGQSPQPIVARLERSVLVDGKVRVVGHRARQGLEGEETALGETQFPHRVPAGHLEQARLEVPHVLQHGLMHRLDIFQGVLLRADERVFFFLFRDVFRSSNVFFYVVEGK